VIFVVDRFFSEFFRFSQGISFNRGSLYSIIIWGMTTRNVGGCSSETSSHPIDMTNSTSTTEERLVFSVSTRKLENQTPKIRKKCPAKIFSGDQPRQTNKRNRRFDITSLMMKTEMIPRNVGFFYSSDAADCPRRFY
jgi:hypothetical protein